MAFVYAIFHQSQTLAVEIFGNNHPVYLRRAFSSVYLLSAKFNTSKGKSAPTLRLRLANEGKHNFQKIFFRIMNKKVDYETKPVSI